MGERHTLGMGEAQGPTQRAAEPGADGHSQERDCLNCGSPLSGRYCSRCGQKAHVPRSLTALAQDFLSGLFNFEGKIWRTLPMLAWRPGDMTRRYIAGERARFVSPAVLYLFSVFAMFAVLNFNGALEPSVRGGVGAGLEAAQADEQRILSRLEVQRRQLAARGANTATLDDLIAARRTDIAQIERLRRGEVVAIEGGNDEVPQWLRPLVEKAQRDPNAFIRNIQEAASKYSWALIPLSVPFLWLLFPFSRRFRLYDHTVFVTYSLSFMMALVIVGGLLVAAGAPSIASMLVLIPPFHMYRQLKGAYGLTRLSAVLRTIALTVFAFVAGTIFFLAALAIGAMS